MNPLGINKVRDKLSVAGAVLGTSMLFFPHAAGGFAFRAYQVWIFEWIVRFLGIGIIVVITFGKQLNQKTVETIEKLDTWLLQGSGRANFLLGSLILCYTVLWCGVTFLRHYYFHSQAFDLAIQDQVVWNTSRGYFFARSFEVNNDLGDHMRPYLALLSLFYLVVPSPYLLLTFQSFVLALSAWPLYFLALRKFDSPAIGLTVAFCALAYPPLGFLNRLDFHAEVIVVPLLVAAYERVDANDLKHAGIFMALALLGKENIGLSVSALGLVTAFYHKHWRFGFAWCVAGLAYSLTALFVVIPAFRGAPLDTLTRYHWLGDTPLEMLWTVVSNPLFIVKTVATAECFLALLQLLTPLAFVPLLALATLFPAAPTLMYNFLSAQPNQSGIYNQYMAPVIPFVMVATVMGLDWLRKPVSKYHDLQSPSLASPRSAQGMGFGVSLLLFATLASWFYENPVRGNPYLTELNRKRVEQRELRATKSSRLSFIQLNDSAIREGLKKVPNDVYLLTGQYYAPHLSHRRQIQIIRRAPVNALEPGVEAIFLNLKDLRRRSCDDYFENLQAAARAGFGVTFFRDGVILVEKDKGDRLKLADLLVPWPGCY